MIIKPSLKTWRAYVVLVPATLLLLFVLTSWWWFDWPRLWATGLILFWLVFGFLLLMACLLPFSLLFTESWEMVGSELIHRLWFNEKRVYQVADIDSFASSFLLSGRPSFWFVGIRPMWLTIQGKRKDFLMFPYFYTFTDLERLKQELNKTNPKIKFASQWF